MPRDVAIVSFAELPSVRREWARDEVEMLVPVITEASSAPASRGAKSASPSRAARTSSSAGPSPS